MEGGGKEEKENERRQEGRKKRDREWKKKKTCLYMILAKHLPVTQEGRASWIELL